MKNVLVIGDSYTFAMGESYHWVNLLKRKYNWNLTNLSIPGSGSFYPIDKILSIKENYDLILISWSEPTRFYHSYAPHLNSAEVANKHFYKKKHKDLYNAAFYYYSYLLEPKIEYLKNKAHLFWFDNLIKERFKDIKFYHFFSFPDEIQNHKESKKIELQNPAHIFNHGINILPTLAYFSFNDPECPDNLGNDRRSGHFSKNVHDDFYNRIYNIFEEENYQDGKVYNLVC